MATTNNYELRMPRIWFMDGCQATVYRKGIPEGMPEKCKMILLPHGPSIKMAGIETDMTKLNEPNPVLGVHGNQVYIQHYYSNNLLLLQVNPEWTVWLGFCTIKGEPMTIGSESFDEINKIMRKVTSYASQVVELESEVERLKERNRKLVLSTTKSIREDMGMVRNEEIRKVLPHELLGTEFGRREEQK